MSVSKNNIVVSENRKSLFPSALAVIDSTVSYNQGDLLVFDTTTKVIKVAAAEADGATFLGVATETVVSGKMKKPYSTDVDSSSAISDVAGPAYGVVAELIAKTGIALAPGDSIYLDPATGAQGVTITGTKVVGIYQGKTVASTVAGQKILVAVGARFPTDAFKF